jgi:hypothetical protein
MVHLSCWQGQETHQMFYTRHKITKDNRRQHGKVRCRRWRRITIRGLCVKRRNQMIFTLNLNHMLDMMARPFSLFDFSGKKKTEIPSILCCCCWEVWEPVIQLALKAVKINIVFSSVAEYIRHLRTCSLFDRLISHQPAVLFSQNKPYFSLRTNQHQSSATSQTNRLVVVVSLGASQVTCTLIYNAVRVHCNTSITLYPSYPSHTLKFCSKHSSPALQCQSC